MNGTGQKTVNISEIFTDQVFSALPLSRVGAMDKYAKENALSLHAPYIHFLRLMKVRCGPSSHSVLDDAIEILQRYGNHHFISQMDPQSQAIVATAFEPVLAEDE
jgi:hypothetical protein